MLFRKTNPYYPDIQLFLILIPIISAINYYLTYRNIQFDWFLALTFSLDTFEGYVAWYCVRLFILFLDRKMPYTQNPSQRILIQVFSTLILGLGVIIIQTETIAWIARGRPAILEFYTIDIIIIGIWFLVINGIYVGLYYYNQWQTSEERRREENRIRTGALPVKLGKQDLLLKFENILGFFVDGDYVAVINKEHKKFYLDYSLDKVEKTIPTTYFFRVNRQFIVHRQIVSGFNRADNGKLNILLTGNSFLPPVVSVSRTKAPAFKVWFNP